MLLVFHVDDTPARLASTHCLPVNDDSPFRTNDGERNHVLEHIRSEAAMGATELTNYPDALIELNLLLIILFRVEGIQADVMVVHLSPNLQYDELIAIFNQAEKRTFSLKESRSSIVKLSALAMTGTTFTTSLSFFITIMSIGRSE